MLLLTPLGLAAAVVLSAAWYAMHDGAARYPDVAPLTLVWLGSWRTLRGLLLVGMFHLAASTALVRAEAGGDMARVFRVHGFLALSYFVAYAASVV